MFSEARSKAIKKFFKIKSPFANYYCGINALVDRFSKDLSLVTLSNLFFDANRQMQFQPFIALIEKFDLCRNYKVVPDKLYQHCDVFGNNFLHIAEILGLWRLSDVLYERAPYLAEEPNMFGQYPMHFAAYHSGHLSKYKTRLLNKLDHRKIDVLNIAASCGAYDNVDYLLRHTDLLLHESGFASFALHGACNHYQTDAATKRCKILISRKLLHKLGAYQAKKQLNYKNAFGMSPAQWLEKTLNGNELDLVYSGFGDSLAS